MNWRESLLTRRAPSLLESALARPGNGANDNTATALIVPRSDEEEGHDHGVALGA